MMEAAGSENLAAGFEDPYPRVGVEWLIAAGPELILDAAPDAGGADAYWSRWPSLAESRDGVVKVPADLVTLPGPHLDRAVDWLSSSIADVLARRSADGS
jgi:hypothetical protein